MKIELEEDKCIASGQCVLAAPEVFDQRDEDGVVITLIDSPDTEGQQHAAREAAALCPALVITIVE